MERENASLKSGVVGLLGAATMGIVMLSPAMTLYGNFGPSFISAGKAAPLAFVWALLATLPTAMSYALLSREYPDSGSAASWMARAGAAGAGQWAGFIVFLYYFDNFVMQPVTLGVFSNDLLAALGAPTGFHGFAAGALLCCSWPAWIAYRGIAPSTKGALGFLLFEAAVVTALCLTVLATGNVRFSTEGFHLAASPEGMSGLFRAMLFGVLAFCGFDVVSTLGEETRTPRKLIPAATILSVLGYGVFVIAGVWCLTYAASPERLKAIADSTGGMPITEIARGLWGRWSLLVPLTGISATLGLAIVTAVGASRILYAMGRDRLAPALFARLHPASGVPWNATRVIFVGGLVCALVTGAFLGPYRAYVWWGAASTFFAMLTYLMVNVSNLLLNRRKALASPLGFLLHVATPLLGIAVDGYILVRSFFVELWKQGWANGQSVIAFGVGAAGLSLVAVLLRWRGAAAGG
jgi:amino acid transporter